MSEPSVLDSLLLEYAIRKRAGNPCAVEDLCAGRPDLVEALRSRVRDFHSMEAFLAQARVPDDTPIPHGETASFAGLAPVAGNGEGGDLPSFLGPDGGTAAQVGPYRILGVVGSGGMGVVLRGEDPVLQRAVAIKVMRPEQAAQVASCERFLREARAVAGLSHPNVVAVHHVGEQGGVPYLVMPLLVGESLADRLKREGTLPVAEAVRIAAEAAEGLAAAHERSLVHRDIKPANLFLEAAQARVKVLDFGLARRADDKTLTGQGYILGTVAYMAPEQARGEAVDARTDLFSLGCVLYEMCAGELPFVGNDVLRVLHALANKEPEPLRELRPEVPVELARLVERMMSKDPAGRPASAAEVVAELRRLLAGGDSGGLGQTTPLLGRPALPGHDRSLPFGRGRFGGGALAVAVAIGLLLLVGVGIGGLMLLSGQEPVGKGPGEPSPEPLAYAGFIDMEMTRRGDPTRQLLPLRDAAARPLQAGDEVRVQVDLNRPGHVYVLWVDAKGEVGLVYPWLDGKWEKKGKDEPVMRLRLPWKDNAWKWWPIDTGPAGLETLVLLVRETALPAEVDLQKELSGLGPQKLASPTGMEVAWFRNGEVVRDEALRGANLGKQLEGSSPLERVNREVQKRVGAHFAFTRSITFGNLGSNEKP